MKERKTRAFTSTSSIWFHSATPHIYIYITCIYTSLLCLHTHTHTHTHLYFLHQLLSTFISPDLIHFIIYNKIQLQYICYCSVYLQISLNFSTSFFEYILKFFAVEVRVDSKSTRNDYCISFTISGASYRIGDFWR
ncbi:hypothetical protein HanRHA438_Chr11g0509101 [Helianthus annuus]|uniref:Uncharacterized protein n=1 Tax=Helianthus annuus TaxID=4232 RepID=A0A251TDS4_HELAN|nr:hypothetical protein HanXRQr2_Chr11g0496541 [Helianthus annuus]KAJ0501971.1 hypothetical protein HanHA300_Chr11g0407241 [Helianthus annuus]KAJ0509915.1 hypothetical protein HanIR_Chr11g0534571 [Helianthus annuus]KAJ0517899.1 hypothetical protein HanHA89_Chr11g0430981 [Helianthus annuus]KAJ0685915.1 hypothetical protein HanLR1_Chr11g0408471 [Helianthus annuus]